MTNPNNIFNEQMTSEEARMTLFKEIEGKTKIEIEQIKAEDFDLFLQK